jgi:hypothetical protein
MKLPEFLISVAAVVVALAVWEFFLRSLVAGIFTSK